MKIGEREASKEIYDFDRVIYQSLLLPLRHSADLRREEGAFAQSIERATPDEEFWVRAPLKPPAPY